MSYARVVMYELKAGTTAVTVQRAKEGLLPLFRRLPGFLSYQVLRVGESALLSISCWETKRAAEQAHRVAAEWMKDRRKNIVESKAHIAEVAFDSQEEPEPAPAPGREPAEAESRV